MVNRIMIASSSKKLISTIETHAVNGGYEIIATASYGYELVRKVKSLTPEIVIIDSELIGGDCVSIIEDFIAGNRSVILVGKSYERYYHKQNPHFEFCEKPLQPNQLIANLRKLTIQRAAVSEKTAKNHPLEEDQRIDEIIQKANVALQEFEKMSEEEAHHYIQRRSMELQISKLEFANRTLKRFKMK